MPPRRPRPRDLTSSWPEVVIDDVPGEVARQIAIAVREAMAGRSLRAVAEASGVDHTTIADVLNGTAWPDLVTVARLETGLDHPLWPPYASSRRRQP